MAVAVKNDAQTAPKQSLSRLAVGSLAGTLYILGSLAVVFYAVPRLWDLLITQNLGDGQGSAVGTSLLMLVMIAVAAGLVILGQRLLGPNPPHGLRAGVFVGAFGALLLGLITRGIGGILERRVPDMNPSVGLAVVGVILVVLLALGAVAFFRAGFESFLVHFEEQGWFSAVAYKRSQGQRVRRGTIIGILSLAACGIYTMSNNMRTSGGVNWEVVIPFTGGQTLVLLPHVQFTLPFVLAAGALWLGYRVVNFPAFADFLVATEAELNKVSWTTRRRLVQDTIVVLTTMVLITVFLFVVDILWFEILSSKWIGVIQTERSNVQKQVNDQDW